MKAPTTLCTPAKPIMPTFLAPSPRRVALLVLGLMASVGTTSCLSSDLNAPRPSLIETLEGNGQTVAPLTQASTPLVVRVSDQDRVVMAGQTVTWRIESGGGTLSATTTVTDNTGRARTFYTAGSATGFVDISATVAGLGSVTFTLTVEASSPPAATRSTRPNTSP